VDQGKRALLVENGVVAMSEIGQDGGRLPGFERPPTEEKPDTRAETGGSPRVKEVDRQQMVLRPVNVEQLIEEDHPARGAGDA
jgi:hypothetical protein